MENRCESEEVKRPPPLAMCVLCLPVCLRVLRALCALSFAQSHRFVFCKCVCVYVCLPASVCVPVCPYVCVCLSLCVCLCACASVSATMPLCPSVCLSVCLLACLSVFGESEGCLSMSSLRFVAIFCFAVVVSELFLCYIKRNSHTTLRLVCDSHSS